MGNPYVRREEVIPLMEMDSPQAVSKSVTSDLLRGDEPGSFREADRLLTMNFHSCMDSLQRDSPVSARPLVKSYMSRLETEELKRLIRVIGFREEPIFPVGWLNPDVERNILTSKDIRTSLEILEGQPVSRRISEIVATDGEPDLSELDMALERFSLDSIGDVKDLPFNAKKGAKHFLDILADRYNIHLILRSKKIGLDRDKMVPMLYTSAGTVGRPQLEQMVDSLSIREALSVLSGSHLEMFFKDADISDMTSLETSLDRMILDGSIGLSHSYASSVGPTIRYMVSKEMEMRNLRIIFQSTFSGWDKDRTRRLLVMEVAQ
jgi:vacuolar-type H+-ATPase subunit C/Vma6